MSTNPAQVIKFILVCLIVNFIIITISLLMAYKLLEPDLRTSIDIPPVSTAQMLMGFEVISVDPFSGQMAVDWYPKCPCPSQQNDSYNIYFDAGLLMLDAANNVPSNFPPPKPTYIFNTLSFCQNDLHDSFSTFRAIHKLFGSNDSSSSMQAYPFDMYTCKIALFAQNAITNVNVGMNLNAALSAPVNFKIEMDNDPPRADDTGIYFGLIISRSVAVRLYVISSIIANWFVTLTFVCITIASIFWNEEVVKEMFVIPVTVLFAFTAVRSTMPGAPTGFGCFVDFVGILPNVFCLTICSCILLGVILWRRIVGQKISSRQEGTG